MNQRHGPSVFPSLGGVRQSGHQRGFSLIELMVALVIGLIIILGAGQLYLMGFQTFRQTELMGNKQAALTFATETLIRDIRRANTVGGTPQISFSSGELEVSFPNNGDTDACDDGDTVVRIYRLSNSQLNAREGWALTMAQNCGTPPTGGFEPLVSSFVSGGFDATDEANGIWAITFTLLSSQDGDSDTFEFRAVNRTAAVN